MNCGYVYCMINESIPNLCKIGFTKKTSLKRAKELYNTSSPTPFKVVFDIKVKNPQKYEKIIHNKLIKFRENIAREFFRCKPEEIKTYFKMENLIQNDNDKNDFNENYYTEYTDDNDDNDNSDDNDNNDNNDDNDNNDYNDNNDDNANDNNYDIEMFKKILSLSKIPEQYIFTSYKLSIFQPTFPDTTKFIKIIDNSDKINKKKYDGLTKIIVNCENNFSIEEKNIIEEYNIKNIEDLLRNEKISKEDKKRSIKCYKIIITRYELTGIEPLQCHNCIKINNILFDIRILIDGSIKYCKSLGEKSLEDFHLISIKE